MIFKEEFVKRAGLLLGKEADDYLNKLSEPLKQAIRVNTIKTKVNELKSRLEKKGWALEPVSFCSNGFWVNEREQSLGNTIEHFLGYYYVQEPASMIPPLVLEPKPEEIVLDCCASPGSKTTQIGAMMNNQGLLIANDVRIDRIKILKINMQRMGVICGVITRRSGQSFKIMKNFFDKVLIDAPCSAEGAIRKNLFIAKQWSVNIIKKLSKDQKELISAGFEALAPGGVLVYSTCTLSPEENEGVINHLINNYPKAKVENFKLKGLKTRPGITEWLKEKYDDSIKNTARVYPMDNDTEGFFVAKVKKDD